MHKIEILFYVSFIFNENYFKIILIYFLKVVCSILCVEILSSNLNRPNKSIIWNNKLFEFYFCDFSEIVLILTLRSRKKYIFFFFKTISSWTYFNDWVEGNTFLFYFCLELKRHSDVLKYFSVKLLHYWGWLKILR